MHSRHRRSAALGTNVLLLGMGNNENENKHTGTALFTVQSSIAPDRPIQLTTERECVLCTIRSRSKSHDNDNAIPRWCSLRSQAWITKSTRRVLLLCCSLGLFFQTGVVNCNLKSLRASLHLIYPHLSGCVQLQNLIRPFEEVIPVSGCRGQAGR